MCDICLGIYGKKQMDGSKICPVCGEVVLEADPTESSKNKREE